MGHIREKSPNHLARALRSDDRGNVMVIEPDGMAFPITQSTFDPWSSADPWGGTAATLPTQAAPQQQTSIMQGQWSNYRQPQPPQHIESPSQAYPTQNQQPEWGQQVPLQGAAKSEADTDSNTESSLGEEINYNTPEFAGLTNPQISEKLWWNMLRSKSIWRKHMHKPVRKARRFFKKALLQVRHLKEKAKNVTT